ncbi:hypothetical protein B296_00056769, partial [Ensete ventricosum]
EVLRQGLVGVGGFPTRPLRRSSQYPDLLPERAECVFRAGKKGHSFRCQENVLYSPGREDLTSAITSGVAVAYGESISAEVWRKGVARHVTFMTLNCLADMSYGRLHLGCRRGCGVGVGLLPTRLLTWPLG